MYTLFIDYRKAFDTVKHESLVELLQSLDVDKSETRLLTNLYGKQTAAVWFGDDISEWLDIKQGVRQGCVASPHLFALYTEMIMRELDDMDGFRIGGTVVNNLRYADDTVIIAESEAQIQNPFLTAQSTQIKSVISVPTKDFIHHYPRALFDIPRVGAHFYDIPGSGRTFTTYPGRDALLRHTRVGTHFYDIPGSGRSLTTYPGRGAV